MTLGQKFLLSLFLLLTLQMASAYPLMIGENVQIYSFQITGKFICKTAPPLV